MTDNIELPPLEQLLSLIHPTSLQRLIQDYARAAVLKDRARQAPAPVEVSRLAEPKINAKGDWRPIRDALEEVYGRLGRTQGPDGYPQADWNLAVLMYEAAAVRRDTTPCIHCSKRIAWTDAFRCLDCRGVMCERCAPDHFGPKHSDRATAAHPAHATDNLQEQASTSGWMQTVREPDPTKLQWDAETGGKPHG